MGSWICAIESPGSDSRYRLHPVEVSKGLIYGGRPLILRAPDGDRSGRRTVPAPLVSVEHQSLWAVVANPRGRGCSILQANLDEIAKLPPGRAVDPCRGSTRDLLGTRTARLQPILSEDGGSPSAIRAYGFRCYVGWRGGVQVVRFARVRSASLALTAMGPSWKPFDLFCVIPPYLMAVDDIYEPKFLMCIDVRDPAAPEVLYGGEFHGLVNGEYWAAAACDHGMILAQSYCVMTGSGQSLELWSVGPTAVQHVADLNEHRWYSYDPGSPADLVEAQHTPGADEEVKERKLASNTVSTAWTGIATLGSQVFVAAGSRGLLHFAVSARGFKVLPPVFQPGEECLDVVAVAGGVVTLVDRSGERRLVRLSVSARGDVAERASLGVDQRVARLVA